MGCIVTVLVVFKLYVLVCAVPVPVHHSAWARAQCMWKALLFPLATTTTVSSNSNDPNWCNRSLFRSRRLLCRSEMWYVHSEATWALAKCSPTTSWLIDVNGMLNKTTRTRRRGFCGRCTATNIGGACFWSDGRDGPPAGACSFCSSWMMLTR